MNSICVCVYDMCVCEYFIKGAGGEVGRGGEVPAQRRHRRDCRKVKSPKINEEA